MNPDVTDHEWCFYLGFNDDDSRNNFVSNLRSSINDYIYPQRVTDSSDKIGTCEIQILPIGTLQIYVTEAKNLAISRLRKELSKNGMRLIDNRLQVRIGFKAPKSIENLFTSIFVEDSMIDSLNTNLHKDEIVVEHDLIPNPSWATEESPAGEMRDMGKLMMLPKTNAMLTISVGVNVMKNRTEQICVFGSGE